MRKKKVLILGGGLSGLVAAWTLLRHAPAGALEVEILERGHLFGGKASSMPHPSDAATYQIDHGLHVVFEYPNLLGLLSDIAPKNLARLRPQRIGARARVGDTTFLPLRPWPLPAPLHLLGGLRASSDAQARQVKFSVIARSRLPSVPKNVIGLMRLWLAALMLESGALSPAERRRLDELPFDVFAERLGLGPALRRSDLFLAAPDSMFSPVASTLAILRALRLTQQSAAAQRVRYVDGPCSEVLIDPILEAVRRAGAQLTRFSPVRRLLVEGARVASIELEQRPRFPHGREKQAGTSYYNSELPRGPALEQQQSADYYISALPPKALSQVLAFDAEPRGPQRADDAGPELDDLTRFYRAIQRLGQHATTRTLACQIYYDRVVTPPELSAMVVGIGGVFSAVVDRGRVWTKPDVPKQVVRASILEFVGTDVRLKDEEITEHAKRLAEQMFPDAKKAQILDLWFHRSMHDEYFEVLPGTDADRPGSVTPLTNLFLAGDFTAHGFANVGMEGAVVSGMEAANRVLSACGWQTAPIVPMAAPGRLVKWLRAVLQRTGTFSWVTGYEQHPTERAAEATLSA